MKNLSAQKILTIVGLVAALGAYLAQVSWAASDLNTRVKTIEQVIVGLVDQKDETNSRLTAIETKLQNQNSILSEIKEDIKQHITTDRR